MIDPENDVQSPSWEKYAWSAWHLLDEVRCTDSPGLYRLRCNGQVGLLYIGETGDSIRSRFGQLRKAMQYAAEGRYAAKGKVGGPPHVAGGCVWKHVCAGRVIEVSWIESPDLDKRERKGVECDLIAAYRRRMGVSPTCQFAGDFEES